MRDELIAKMQTAFQAGQWKECEFNARSLIRAEIGYLPAFYYLGKAAAGKSDWHNAFYLLWYCAVESASEATAVQANYWFELGQVLQHLGRKKEALACLERSRQLLPDARCDEALIACKASEPEVVVEDGEAASQLNDRASATFARKQIESGIQLLDQAIRLFPRGVISYIRRGLFLDALGRVEESLACLRFALQSQPGHVQGLKALLQVLQRLKAYAPAFAWIDRLEQVNGRNSYSLSVRAVCLKGVEKHQERYRLMHDSMSMGCRDADFVLSYGDATFSLGKFDEFFDFVEPFAPADLFGMGSDVYSNYLFYLLFTDRYSIQEVQRQHEVISGLLEQSIVPFEHEKRQQRANGKLRVGFVSPDMCVHPVANFMLPLWRCLDRSRFEVYGYYTKPMPDFVTFEMMGLADKWTPAHEMKAAELAQRIRNDEVDILVDTTGYTAGGLAAVFAAKPAPVQVAWMGYPHPTGLSRMDYRITDDYADPQQGNDPVMERPWRLPDGYFCYAPFEEIKVEPAPDLPCATGTPFTFACLNKYMKVTDAVARLWARILRAAPDARLLLSVGSRDEADSRETREAALQRFQQLGVGAEQIAFTPRVTRPDYYRLYHGVDVILDTFPFNGGTTTCDALWMGVPVIALTGQHFTSRMGVSILSNTGMSECVASTEEAYVDLALKAYHDREWLKHIRGDLAQRFRSSPMMDGERFAQNVGEAFIQMWAASSSGVGDQ